MCYFLKFNHICGFFSVFSENCFNLWVQHQVAGQVWYDNGSFMQCYVSSLYQCSVALAWFTFQELAKVSFFSVLGFFKLLTDMVHDSWSATFSTDYSADCSAEMIDKLAEVSSLQKCAWGLCCAYMFSQSLVMIMTAKISM